MEVGLIGLPAAGKTTLFNALTGSHASGFGERANVGVAPIPDPRLGVIASFITTQKIVPATIELVDIPGVPPGSDSRKLNSFLEQIRQFDAICQVVRCFDDGTGRIDPEGDIDRMETELVLADLVVAESAQDKASRHARSGEREAKARLGLLERVIPVLEDGRPVRTLGDLSEADQGMIKGYGFITAKPVLYVANVSEDDVGGESEHARSVRLIAEQRRGGSVAVCAKLEAELSELEEPDRGEMLQGLGLSEPAVGPLARSAHELLGLTTFYTAGPKEVRSWTIPQGATAPEAAGAIHSDMQRGFIRAECYNIDELQRHKTEKAIRDAGKLRSEGKSYQLRDGDVVHFLFNV